MAARFTSGISPSSLAGAYSDWTFHLATAPGKQIQLIEKATKKALRIAKYISHCMFDNGGDSPCIEPLG